MATVVEQLIEFQNEWKSFLKAVMERQQRATAILDEFSQLHSQIVLVVSVTQGLGPIYG